MVTPILRHQAESGADGVARRVRRHGTAIEDHTAGHAGANAANCLGQLGAAGADEPREAKHLAAVDAQRHLDARISRGTYLIEV